jgi:hypothetical protein
MREEVSILSGFDLPHSCTNNTKQWNKRKKGIE